MKRADLFPSKPRQAKQPAGGFTAEQAAANRALYEQELRELGDKASVYFQDFYVGKTRRCWILPEAETYLDLNDTRIDFVLKNLVWFKAQIAKCTRTEDDLPF